MFSVLLLLTACLVALLGPAVRLTGLHLPPVAGVLVFGISVVGAAAVLAWATEVAQVDVSRAIAYSALALVAVLPEYAVDMYFAYTAAHNPEYAAYAAANMTGANRLLVGLGWPLVVLLGWLATRRPRQGEDHAEAGRGWPVRLPSDARLDNGVLAVATIYAFIIPFKGTIDLFDAAVLLAMFGFYAWRAAQAKQVEPELFGPPALLATLPSGSRRAATLVLFIVAAASILAVAEPFAEALVEAGSALGVDRFLLVQWLAPLASEMPELLVVSLLALRGAAGLGLAALLASRLNQWTLLVGMLPIAYSVGAGAPRALPLDAHQSEEVLLTAAQSLLAFAFLLDLRLSTRDALFLFGLFAVQFVMPQVRLAVTGVYLVLAVVILVANRDDLLPYLPTAWRGRPADEGAPH